MIETKWAKEIIYDYKSGISNFFIIDGNIDDYPAPNFLFDDYLAEVLCFQGFEEVHFLTLNNSSNLVRDTKNKMKNKENIAVVIKYPEQIFPNVPLTQMNTEQALDFIQFSELIKGKEFIKSNNMLILLTESSFSLNRSLLNLNSRSSLIKVDFPNYSKRLDFLKYLEETSTAPPRYEGTLEEMANMTAGLTLVGIEDIYLQGEYQGELRRDFIIDRKNDLIRKEYGDVLEILDTNVDFSHFAGQEHLKDYHKEVVIKPMMTGNTKIVPKGLLYTGPPGTGKTHFARCLSGEAGLNFVELKMSRILDKWVGESEKKFDKALKCIKSIAPVGVFIDEIDQVFSRGDNQSNNVDSSLFSMFLTILSDESNRGKIIWIGAANYPNKIDEALKRAGRFDKKIPFLPPDRKAVKETLIIHLKKSKYDIDDNSLTEVSKAMDGYTQAEIENIVIKAREISLREGKSKITFSDLNKALSFIKPFNSENIREMIDISIKECNDLEFMPPGYSKDL